MDQHFLHSHTAISLILQKHDITGSEITTETSAIGGITDSVKSKNSLRSS